MRPAAGFRKCSIFPLFPDVFLTSQQKKFTAKEEYILPQYSTEQSPTAATAVRQARAAQKEPPTLAGRRLFSLFRGGVPRAFGGLCPRGGVLLVHSLPKTGVGEGAGGALVGVVHVRRRVRPRCEAARGSSQGLCMRISLLSYKRCVLDIRRNLLRNSLAAVHDVEMSLDGI